MTPNASLAVVLCVLAGAVSLACGGGGVAESPGYFAADGHARRAGHGLLLGGSVESGVLPVAVDSTGAAEVVGPSLEQPIELGPSSVVTVRGSQGTVARLRLGIDVDPDALLVQGSEKAVVDLARQLEGDAQPSGGGYVLRAPGALHKVTTAQLPEGLEEVMPFETNFAAFVTHEPALDVATQPASPAADSVENSAAFLGAFGRGPLPVCDGVAGTWQARLQWKDTGYWYHFTLDVEQRSRDASAISGRIRAQTWDGGVLDADPPVTCQAGDNVDHFVVEMPAAGRLSAERRLTFAGRSWRTTALHCGRAPTRDEYCADRFIGKLSSDGHLLYAQNDDGCTSIESIVFVRTACTANTRAER